jgi:hypothetical protein
MGPDVIGPRRCPTWSSLWSKLRSDRHNSKAPDESGAVPMGSDRGDGGMGQAGRSFYNVRRTELDRISALRAINRMISV